MRFICIFLLLLVVTSLHGQIITTVAGNGTYGGAGDGGPAINAQLAWPFGVAADNAGNIYIADMDNNVIRQVNSAGIITSFAGTGVLGYSGDGGSAASAQLYHPMCITLDNTGTVYFTDQNGSVIRKISTSGIITTITGNLPSGYSGDGGPLIAARLGSISGIQFDNMNNMYLSDYTNNVIRKVNSAGIITTIAGNGTSGFSGDGGPATAAMLYAPYGVLFRSNGDMFIPDNGNKRVRVVNSAGIITTYAGTGVTGYTGDGGPANLATFRCPWNSATDPSGNIYVADGCSNVVRKIDNSGVITTYAGNGTPGYSGDGGLATAAQMMDVCGVASDAAGNIYIVNRTLPNVVRKVTNCLTALISQQPANVALCNSGSAVFTVTASGSTGYQWQVNAGSGWTDLSDNSVYSGTTTGTLAIANATTGMHSYQYRCAVTNGCGAVFSMPALLSVATPVSPSVTVTASATHICEGVSVNFTAVPQNGGAAPVYQWQKNGISVGANNSSYSDNKLNNGDVVSCILTSNSACSIGHTATSNTMIMTVTANVTPTIAVSPSAGNICSGTPVTFTATVTNGGGSPAYSWFKNNVRLSVNAPAYTEHALNNGDVITCSLLSSLSCVSSATAASLPVTMAVMPSVAPAVIISASTASACPNTPVAFTAAPVNGGSSPGYQWKKNGSPVGGNSDRYSDNNLVTGDAVTCTIMSNAGCSINPQATSNAVSINVYRNPVVALDKTNSLCEGGSRALDAGSYASYLWNTGATGRAITINQTGVYSVTVKDNNGCTGTDTARVTTVIPAPAKFLPGDTSICSYGDLLIKPAFRFESYLWNNGSGSPAITITRPGRYWLQVKDSKGCSGSDTILVVAKDCLQGFFMPTAFTPNHDGKNDFMKPLLFGKIRQYNFRIYDRWGQPVFHSTDVARGWDGNHKQQGQESNVYIWVCTYQLEGEALQNKKGTFILIR